MAIISVLLGAAGQVLVKMGARNLELSFAWHDLFASLWTILRNLPVMSGLLLYGLSFLLWVKVLTELDLSYAYPLVSLGYILVIICSYFLFKEQLSAYRLFGILLIIAGVVVVARS
jgi:multidrug transporter EmrE-like cation transporter